MKITIKKGELVEDAIRYVKEFLHEKCSCYPVLKNNMNIYVILKDSNNSICPDNEKEYILDESGIRDMLQEAKESALEEVIEKWDSHYYDKNMELSNIKRDIELDKKNI